MFIMAETLSCGLQRFHYLPGNRIRRALRSLRQETVRCLTFVTARAATFIAANALSRLACEAGVPDPKFALLRSTFRANFGSDKDTRKIMILVSFMVQKFARWTQGDYGANLRTTTLAIVFNQ
jgi:hypothetical protein